MLFAIAGYERRLQAIEGSLTQLKSDIQEIKSNLQQLGERVIADDRANMDYIEGLRRQHEGLDEEISSLRSALETEMSEDYEWAEIVKEVDGNP